jgi:hypothetical protein
VVRGVSTCALSYELTLLATQDLTISVLREKRRLILTVQPVDLATRLREVRKERQQQMMQDRLRFQELGPFRFQ